MLSCMSLKKVMQGKKIFSKLQKMPVLEMNKYKTFEFMNQIFIFQCTSVFLFLNSVANLQSFD